MNIKRPDFVEHWEWSHWAVLAMIVVLTIHQVYKRQVERISRVEMANVEFIEEDIREFNTQAERLGQMEVLPPVRSQWDYVVAIVDKYGVDISLVADNRKQKNAYDGPLASWTADLKGGVGAVLVAAKEIQNTVPAHLYNVTLGDNVASIRLSVLGSE